MNSSLSTKRKEKTKIKQALSQKYNISIVDVFKFHSWNRGNSATAFPNIFGKNNKTTPSGCGCIEHRWQTALLSAQTASICCNNLSLVSDSDTEFQCLHVPQRMVAGGKGLLIIF